MTRLLCASSLALIAATAANAAVTMQDLDVTGDQFATYQEVANAVPRIDRVAFGHMDTNGDGRLSATEIATSEAQAEFSQHQVLATDKRPLSLIDGDSDGFMSYDDLARVYPSLTEASFKGMDSNGDNRLSYAEYYEMDAQTALAQCEDSTYLDLASMDQNNDKFLTMEELKVGYPKATASDFRTIDINRDNRVSAVELLAPSAQCLEGKQGS